MLPSMLTVVSGLSPPDDALDCDKPGVTEARPVADILGLLDELHALYAGLPGFVDVYYYPGEAVEFRPMFIAAVPEGAAAIQAPVPVSFDVLAEDPRAMGPGLVPDAGDLQCTGIRPGARLTTPSTCTMNFVFTDPQGDLYIGTAGHCIETGQAAHISNIGLIGTAVFSTGDGGVGDDFALIKVNADKVALVNPEMCDWAGPTGVFNGASITGRRVLHTGHGYGVVGTVTPVPPRPKEGVGTAYGATSLTWAGTPWPGDSGSAIRLDGGTAVGTQGQGVGILTHGIGVSAVGAPAGLGFGTRLDKAIQMSGISGLSLVTVSYTHLH